MPSLSVCCMTADPPSQVATMLAGLRAVADEIVVAADTRLDPRLLAAYDGVADRVVRFAFRPPVDRPRAWLAAQCSGDWLLSVDGDEVPSAALVDALPDLVAATDVVQYSLPRRWLFPDATTWLDEPPWWPDFQVRLARNDATLAARAEHHAGLVPVLPARHVDAPLYHLDCLVNDEAARAAKAARYASSAPQGQPEPSAYGGGRLNDVLYAPERWAQGAGRPVPMVDRPAIDAALAARTTIPASPPVVHPPVVPPAAIDALASSPFIDQDDYRVALGLFESAEPTRHGAADDGAADAGAADAGAADAGVADAGAARPRLRMAPGELRPVYVTVENRGGATWPWGLDQHPEVRVSYHWRDAEGRMVIHDGRRSPLPCSLPPGSSTIVPTWVEAPTRPGDHLLEIDLVHEHVRWFHAPLAVEVLVADRPVPAAAAAAAAGGPPC